MQTQPMEPHSVRAFRWTGWQAASLSGTFGVLLFLQQRSIRWQQNDPDRRFSLQSLTGQTQQTKIYVALLKHLEPLKSRSDDYTLISDQITCWPPLHYKDVFHEKVCRQSATHFCETLNSLKPREHFLLLHNMSAEEPQAGLSCERMCSIDQFWFTVRWDAEEGHSAELSVAAEADKTSQEQTASAFQREEKVVSSELIVENQAAET